MILRFGSSGATALLTALILVLVGSWGHSTGSPGYHGASEERPNLVLVTIDSLRADHLGVYGYRRPTSPNIDAFAREAVVVSDAIAQAPQTKASIASLMTSLFPAAHRAAATTVPLDVLRELGSTGSYAADRTDVLSADLPTLPRSLRAAGYYTMAFTANPYLIPDFGFANGFVQFKYVKGASAAYAHADVMMTEAARAVAAAPEPFFLWVHLMDPHNPYDPPEPFRSRLPACKPSRPIDPARIPDRVKLGTSTDLNLYLARYDAGILTADYAFGRLLSMLRARHTWSRTAVVLTADHGEGFLEHDLMSHGNSLYEELLHVPLIAKLPGVRPGVVQAVVQLTDLFPTLARLTGATPPPRRTGAMSCPCSRGFTPADHMRSRNSWIGASRFGRSNGSSSRRSRADASSSTSGRTAGRPRISRVASQPTLSGSSTSWHGCSPWLFEMARPSSSARSRCHRRFWSGSAPSAISAGSGRPAPAMAGHLLTHHA